MPAPRKRHPKSEWTRELLVQAGERLLAVRALDEVSVEEIAREADVAYGLLFHYFSTKLDFYLEICRRAAERLEETRNAGTRNGTPDERLARFLSIHIAFVRTRQGAYLYHMRGSTPASVKQLWETSKLGAVRLALGFYLPEIEITPAVMALGRGWLAFVDEMLVAWFSGLDTTEPQVSAACTRMFHDMLGIARVFCPTGATQQRLAS